MRNLQKPLRYRGWKAVWQSVALGVLCATALSGFAQPANDNFANAEDIADVWGSVSNTTSLATGEVGEPNHAGFPAFSSIWYRWLAPQDGEVQLDTLSSTTDTLLAVYTGNSLATLRQVAANDDLFPFTQLNQSGNSFITQPFNGPSGLRFNARAGTTYYFAVAAKSNPGPVILGWAYQAAGVFRFATEDAVSTFVFDTNMVPPFRFVTTPVYQVSENESLAIEDASTVQTYYQFGVPGLLVTVTRLAGSSGRMLVDYSTEDITNAIAGDVPATAFLDYIPVQGTLVFDDFEMTKRILVQIQPSFFTPETNRDFAIVLSNARPDPGESPNVSPPRIDGGYGRAIVRILDADIDPVFFRNLQADTNDPPVITFQPTNAVFNLARKAFRTIEDVNGYWTEVDIWIDRTGTNRDSVTLHYRIDNFVGANDNSDPAELDNNFFPLQPGSDYATPTPEDPDTNGNRAIGIYGVNADFFLEGVPRNNYTFPGGGTITFPGGNRFNESRALTFRVNNDTLTEFNEDFHISLYANRNDIDGDRVGMIDHGTVTILFDDQDPPAGSVDQYHNPDFGVSMVPPITTTPPNLARPGADSVVYGLVVLADNRTVIAGDFLSFNATARGRIARLNVDGSLDTTFNPGGGANDFIGALAQTGSGQFIIGGGFSSYNGVPRPRVARINANGALDTSFSSGLGPNASVWAVAVQPDGKAIIGGEFTTVNGLTRQRVARLNTDGSLDATFDPGINGPDGTVWDLALQPDGKVVIGGEFGAVGGVVRGGIARLNTDGTHDTSFDPVAGTDGVVYALALQADGRVLVGGEFSQFDFSPRNNLTRLNANGSLDATFDPGSRGADRVVYSLAVGNAGIYVGGAFDKYNGTHRRSIVRLFPNGTVDTGFLDTSYNQFAGLHRARFVDHPGIVYAMGVQSDGNLMIAGSFQQVGGGQASPLVRPEASADFNLWTEPKARDGVRNRNNVARLLGGSTPGPGNLSLAANNHIANENQSFLSVALTRNNGTLGFLSANFEVEEGLVQSGVDYLYNAIPPIYLSTWQLFTATPSAPNSTTRMHSDGLFGDSLIPTDLFGTLWFGYTPGELNITVLNDSIAQGDRNTTFRLSNPSGADLFYLGGENIPLGGALGFSQAPFTIVDDDNQRGVLGFSTANLVVNENVGKAVITVTRTNGSSGSVSVQYATVPGGSATAGVDYTTASGTLTLVNQQTERTFEITIAPDSGVEPDETIFLRLFNPGNGATLGLSNAVVTIVDDDTPGGKLNFSSATYSTNENAGAAAITVTRSGSSAGTLTVQAAATNGTAINGVNFTAVTNTLVWVNGDVTPKTFTIPLLDDTLINADRTVNLRLFNATLNSSPNPVSLGPTATAQLAIVNEDFPGQVSFSASTYNVNENGGTAIISVVRVGGSAATVTVNFAAFNGTAVGGFDFTPTNGLLTFGPGELVKSFTVPITPNSDPDLPRFISLALSNAAPAGALGAPGAGIINIIDDESVNEPPGGPDTLFTPSGMNDSVFALALQSDGKLLAAGDFTVANQVPRLRIVRLNPLDGSVDSTFAAAANATIQTLAHQTDGRTVIGGAFTTVNGVVRNRIARLSSNGALDTVFNPGSGTDNPVFAAAESFLNGTRKIFIGGSFTTYNGTGRNRIARLNNDGSLDGAFDPGTGADGVVYALAAYPTNTPEAGKIIIVGDFTGVNGVGRSRIARLNSDGSLDSSFNPGSGANDAIRAVALQAEGRILIGGSFTNFNGTAINRIARLNADGSLDPTFTPGAGADDVVNSITVQGDTRIVLGGQFSHCNGVTRNRITRLNNNGTADATINFGAGANDFVAATLVQPDDKIVIGGGFTEYDGAPRQRIARIYGRSLAGSGTLEFTSASYQASESATNASLTVRRFGGTAGLTPGASISVDAVTSDGTATNGIHYLRGTNTLIFAEGEVFQTFTVPVIDNFEINPSRTVNLTLGPILPPGSASLGNQPTATLTILDDDTGISFSSAIYTRNENSPDQQATITIVRTGSIAEPATVNFTTTTNGTATAGLDYLPVTNLVSFAIGETTRIVTVPILNDLLIEGHETVTIELTNAVGGLLLAPTRATLTIVDDDIGPGQIAFAAASFAAAENGGNAVITLTRTNGSSGVVGVTFKTSDFTAVAGLDYTAVNTPITFGDGEVVKQVLVPVLDDAVVEGSEIFHVTLTNATGGPTIVEPTTVPVTILDNDMGVSFSSPFYSMDESGPSVTITVLRLGGSNGVTTVRYDTTNLTATAGLDFTGVANGLLTFAHGETLKTFTIPILEDDLVEGDEAFGVNLSNPSAGQLLIRSTIVGILDNETGFSLSTNSYAVDEAATNVMITVFRTNANTGSASVSLTTSDDTAIAGADYTGFGSSLNFTNGEAVKTVLIPIINDTAVEAGETFQVSLSGPSPGARILGVAGATVTIHDNDAGLQFSTANYTVPEIGVAATITVVRSGLTNSTVAASFSTSDGTAAVGLDYAATNGLMVFTNGELSKTFSVQIIDDTIEEGAETILLSLSSPTGQVSLLNPSAATLTIVDNDGGSILPAGTLLTAENELPNGAIDSGETVTLLFALRNASGVDTTNLVATLLATNGVAAPSGAQNYGALANNGASASRPFSFTANGTNGGLIAATFQVQDGSSSYGRVTFDFLLGHRTTIFSNTASITIVDLAPASPYPSSITVTGLVGIITSVTATVTNLSHQAPDDVDMLLAGPTGATTMLMSDAGGGNLFTNVTLTFDDAALNFLPDSTLISSGTNKPTNHVLADAFPAPAPPAPWGATLSVFTNTNPNGLWSLYIVDDLQIMSGSISRGWNLAITTLGAIPAATDLSVRMTAAPNPVVVGNSLTYSILVTNHGPWTASGVKLTNAIPVGATFVSAAPSVGTIATNSGAVVWTLGPMLKDAVATATVVIRPGVLGAAVSSSSVLGVESDPNPGNNLVVTTNSVIAPIADLALDVVGSPNPLFISANNNLTYTITVNNLGPATATGVAVTNTLSPAVTFLSATPSGYTVVGPVVTFTNLGILASGAQTMAAIVVRAVTPATLTNDTTVGSVVTDPLKGNNAVSVKTIVEFPQVGFTRSDNNLVITWPADATDYALERTSSLTPPVVWTLVTTPAPRSVGDQKTVTIPIGAGNEFFRLRAVGP